MSHQSTHHYPSLNSIPQTHPPLPTNFATPIKPSNESDDDDVVFLTSVPKVPHTPDEYDPKCKCSTCQLATKLLAECTCAECRGQQAKQVNQTEGQVEQSNKNELIHNEVPPLNAQLSESSIQNNGESKSEHSDGNDQDDNRSSTPDHQPRLFDDESGDSSSDDSEDDDSVDDEADDKEQSQESESDGSDQEYAFSSKSLKKSNAKSHLSKRVKTIDFKKSNKCSCCNQFFLLTRNLKLHYNEVHLNLKRQRSIKTSLSSSRTDCPHCGRNVHSRLLEGHLLSNKNPGFRCAWPKCAFFYSQLSEAKAHICADHLQVETANTQQINQHLVKVNPSTGKTRKVSHRQTVSSTTFNSNCPKCGRNFRNGGLFKRHLGTHANSGFRCTWRECGFFFSKHETAKQHILEDHFKGKLVNSTQLNEHLVNVDAKSVKQSADVMSKGKIVQSCKNVTIANRVSPTNSQPSRSSIQNNDASTSECMNGNDQEDDRGSRSSTPDYHPRLFDDDENGDSSSNESEDDDSVDDEDDDKGPNIESDSDPEYAFSRPSKNKESRKKSDAKVQLSKHAKTIESNKSHKCQTCNKAFLTAGNLRRHDREQHQHLTREESFRTSRSDCPHCGRNVYSINLTNHLRTHKYFGYRCVWPKCGFFYSQHSEARKHVCAEHLQVEKANSRQINPHLVKVDPLTGKIEKFAVRREKREDLNSPAFNSNCPTCGRNFRNGGLFKRHLGSHTKGGFRCTWQNCGFFFSGLAPAKQHILRGHFKGKLINAKQIREHLIKVEPNK